MATHPLRVRRFGQHFLERAWARKVIEVIDPRSSDVFLEIGPGRGALTLPLAARAGAVVAVEVDRDLAADLERHAPPNVRIVSADILDTDISALVPPEQRPVRVAGNLPYNISTPILSRLVAGAEDGRFFSDATLMVQREVADRLAAGPGSRDYGVLGILTQLHAEIERRLVLPPGAFRPPPQVTSAVVRLTFRPPRLPLADPHLFSAMVRAMFMHRRKTLGNALQPFAADRGTSAVEALAKAGLSPQRRPETLELTELAHLADVFVSGVRPDVL